MAAVLRSRARRADRTSAAPRASLYDEVTAKIVAELEAGRFPWVQPWSATGAGVGLPRNAGSGRSYSGVNILILWGAVIEHSYAGQGWLTFRQALSLTDALTAWLARQGSHELDDRFGARLDRMGRALDRAERKLDLATELLGVFVQHQLTLTAEHPAFNAQAQALGRERFLQLVDLVKQRLSGTQRGVVARVLAEDKR